MLVWARFGKQRIGHYPEERIVDSRLTTDARWNELNGLGSHGITLRRRSPQILREIATAPASTWRQIELTNVTRLYRTSRILDRRIRLPGEDGPVRPWTITDLGHEEPTLLLTNQLTQSPARLMGR